jgi:HSP20 family molecular chaperone IbpA
MRLGSETSFAFLELDDRAVQVRLTEGLMNIRLRQLDEFETFEVDTRDVLGLTEANDEIRLNTVVPGFGARTLAVEVLPNSITIECQVRYTKHPGEEKIHFSEFGEKLLLRQFDLPARIDPNEVTATLEDGVLGIAAKKAAVTIAPMTAEVKTRRTAA